MIEKPSLTIRMQPVHKVFGLVMTISLIARLSFKYRALLNHLKARAAAVTGGVLVVMLHGPKTRIGSKGPFSQLTGAPENPGTSTSV